MRRRLLVTAVALVSLAVSSGVLGACSQGYGIDEDNGVISINGVPQCEYGMDHWTHECY